MKNIAVVTGGAGFIGSHVVDRLLDAGYRVIALDNLATGSTNNLERASRHPDFQFIRYDVTNEFPIVGDVSYVFHLASPASVIDYQSMPEETALTNSTGTRNALLMAKAYKARFLFTSTSEVYGDAREHPQKESYWGNVNPVGIRACYDESKRYGEMMTMLYARKYDLDVRIIRIFNTYGPRMRRDDGRVVSNFINQALDGKPLTVYGDGSHTRSFCYVSDMVEGLYKGMFSKGTNGEIINIGNPQELKVSVLAKTVKRLTESKSRIIYSDLPEDDPVKRRPDISKAKKLLTWEPKVDLEEGLQKTIAYYKSIK